MAKKDFVIDYVGLAILKGVAQLVRIVPMRANLAFARCVGTLIYLVDRHKRVAYANLKAAFGVRYTPSARRALIRSLYQHLAQSFIEMLYFPHMKKRYADQYLSIPDIHHIDEALALGKGAIALTGHFGNWELSQLTSSIYGRPSLVLGRDQKHPRLNDYLCQLRAAQGSRAVSTGWALREVIKALRHNELVGMLGDQGSKQGGVVVRFFGRLIEIPAGPFALARRTGCIILPCFIARERGPWHHISVGTPLPLQMTDNEAADLRANAEQYVRELERWITAYPTQWLWLHKQWKRTTTKHIVVLSDGKAGHDAQSQALAQHFQQMHTVNNREWEFHLHTVPVQFRHPLARTLCALLTPLVLPIMQGRLSWFRHFLTHASSQALEAQYADIVISCGASLAPLNVALARECLAKSVMLMTPPFPYSHYHYDLRFVPAHDGSRTGRHTMATVLTPSKVTPQYVLAEGERLRTQLSLHHEPCISVLLGGDTKQYQMDGARVQQSIATLLQVAQQGAIELLVTTSRRTRSDLPALLKQQLAQEPRCRLLVLANERNIPNIVYGMMGLSQVIVVSEDSVSMISEAVASGKPVVVVRLAATPPSAKHQRFQELLQARGALRVAEPATLAHVLTEVLRSQPSQTLLDESVAIAARLGELL